MSSSQRGSKPPTRGPRRGAGWKDPSLPFGLLAFGLALALAAVLYWAVDLLDLVLSWLTAITIVTFLAFGYDKAVAATRRTRVPEKVLLVLALAGGTFGALAGMLVFRHKTAKARFQLMFLLVVAAQVALLILYYVMIKPYLGVSS